MYLGLNKNLFFMLVAIVVLSLTLIVGVVLQNFQKNPFPSKALVKSDLSPEQLDKIVIKNPTASPADQEIVLTKQPSGEWGGQFQEGEELRLSSERITDFINSLKSLSTSGLVSRETDSYGDFSLSDDKAISLSLFHNRETKAQLLFFGSLSSQGADQYVRFEADPAVYLAKGNVDFYLKQNMQYWFDKRVFPADVKEADLTAAVLRIEGAGAKAVSLIKEHDQGTDSWKSSELPEAAHETLAAFVSDLANLEGEELAAVESGLNGKKLSLSLELKTANKSYGLKFYSEDGNTNVYWALPDFDNPGVEGGKKYLYRIASWKLKQDIWDKKS